MGPLLVLLEFFYGLLMALTVVGNTLVIEAVRRNAQLRSIPNICITSLAIADLLVGLVNMPLFMYLITNPTTSYSKDYLMIQYSLDIYFSVASILNLCLISLDRLYATICPVKRLTLQKRKYLSSRIDINFFDHLFHTLWQNKLNITSKIRQLMIFLTLAQLLCL